MTELDHITITAHTLKQGVAYVRDMLGVGIPYGGEHVSMGTHNHLLRLGSKLFLEVIAVNPASAPPQRPRWFQLDEPAFQIQLQEKPKLTTWVVRTDDIAATCLLSQMPPGPIESMSRGDWHWRITVAHDGSLPDHGLLPTLVQWSDRNHPADRMADSGCSLECLQVVHREPDHYRKQLVAIGADHCVETLQAPPGIASHLVARIRTPRGLVTLA